MALGSPGTHQLFMDDLKVYACSKRKLSNTVNVVERVLKAIGMKCALAQMVQDNIHVEDHTLPEEGRLIA